MITLAVSFWCQDFKPKYAPIATGWLLRHVWLLNMCRTMPRDRVFPDPSAAFQSLVACASGWEAMAQRDNRCSCKKNKRIFLCQTVSSNWVLGVFWVYYKMDILKLITQSGFWFFKLLRAPRSLFLVYKLDLKKWLKRAFENHFDKKTKSILF